MGMKIFINKNNSIDEKRAQLPCHAEALARADARVAVGLAKKHSALDELANKSISTSFVTLSSQAWSARAGPKLSATFLLIGAMQKF